MYAKSNSSASQEIPDYDEFDVEEEDEVKSFAKTEEQDDDEAKPPSAKKAKIDDESPAGVCAGYSKSLKPSSLAEAFTDKVLTGIANNAEKYTSKFGKLNDYEEDD